MLVQEWMMLGDGHSIDGGDSARGNGGRILHVTDCYAGGVSRALTSMVRNASQWEHLLAYHGEDRPPRGLFAKEFKISGNRARRMRDFRRVVREQQVDLVHAHSSWAAGFVRLGRNLGTPVVYQPHCYKFVDPGLPRVVATLLRRAEQALLVNTSSTAVLSPAERAAAVSLGATHVVMIPNVGSLPSTLRSPEPTRHILMTGRLVDQKDPEYFAEVVHAARARCPDLRATWIGDGDPARRAALEAAGITVTGWLDSSSMVRALAGGGIHVHSAAYEGFPLAVLDAAQAGLPVLMRRTASSEGIDLPQCDHPAEFAEAIDRLVGSPAEWRDAVGRARQLLTRHNDAHQADALASLYSSVARSTPSPGNPLG